MILYGSVRNGVAQYDLACSIAVKSDSMRFVSVCGTVQYSAKQYAVVRNGAEQYHVASRVCSKVRSSAVKHDWH